LKLTERSFEALAWLLEVAALELKGERKRQTAEQAPTGS
jgi:hypothetical protein